MKVKECTIYVSHPETGSSSSYSDPDIAVCLQWALAWAGVEFRVEAVLDD